MQDKTETKDVKQATTNLPVPYFQMLQTVHKVKAYTVVEPNTPAAQEMDMLLNSGNVEEYRQKLAEYKQDGIEFVSTENGMMQIADSDKEIEVRLAVQVKGYTITWYFWTDPKHQDLYSQEWRDKIYDTAALCHSTVDNACSLYYRGSNAFHLKTMHAHEGEGLRNHNHYRMLDNQPVTPHDFRQHMQAFKDPKHKAVFDEFFVKERVLANGTKTGKDEIDFLCDNFDKFHAEWTKKQGSEQSRAEKYAADPSQKLTDADMLEFQIFGTQQEPCRLSVDELNVDYEKARKQIEASVGVVKELDAKDPSPENKIKIQMLKQSILQVEKEYGELLEFRRKGGSRGIGSDRAFTRQLPGSSLPTHPLPEAVGKETPVVPEWATSAKARIKEAEAKFFGKEMPVVDTSTLSHETLTEIGISKPMMKKQTLNVVAEFKEQQKSLLQQNSTEITDNKTPDEQTQTIPSKKG